MKNISDEITHFVLTRFLIKKSGSFIIPNVFIGHWEADVLEITKSGYMYEYEIKVSKEDFRADAKKILISGLSKHDSLKKGNRVNYFYFIVPKGLIPIQEVPEFAGLMEYENATWRTLETVKTAPKLSKDRLYTEKIRDKIFQSIYFRYHKIRIKLKENK